MTDRCEWCEKGLYRFNVKNACCRLKELCQLPPDALRAHAMGLATDAERDTLREEIRAERTRLKEIRKPNAPAEREKALQAARTRG